MAGFNGPALTIDYDSTTLAHVRNKTLSVANELVDVTTDDDDGWATFLPKPGKRVVSGTVAGITSDEVLMAAIFDATNVGGTLVVNLPSDLATPGDVTGTCLWQSIEISAAHDGSVEFTANWTLSGPAVYTPSAA